jgi:hypothetical protein
VTFRLLALFLCAACQGAEVPDAIIRGLVMVESGCEWRSMGDIRGKWERGADAEVSPFQLSPAALSDMRVRDANRVHRDVVYAESLARLWLSRCYQRHGNWPEALAAYNGGSRYRTRGAKDYAARILNIAGEQQ